MKIGLPGSYEPKRIDTMAHHSQISEAFGLDPTEQILYEIQASNNKYKSREQETNEAFGLKQRRE